MHDDEVQGRDKCLRTAGTCRTSTLSAGFWSVPGFQPEQMKRASNGVERGELFCP